MTTRSIQGIYLPPAPHWVGDGFQVQQLIPGPRHLVQEVSPFLMMDYHPPAYYPPAEKQRGVGSHPHRGFETVTIVYSGKVAHKDSAGNSGIIGPGDVQWMTAASGILHEEFHEQEFTRTGGVLHSVQLWVNLPAKDKMAAPRYQTLLNQDIPVVKLDDQGSILRVIAGEFDQVKGSALTWSPVSLFDVTLQAQGKLKLDLPAEHNVVLLVISGQVKLNNQQSARQQELIVFEHDGSLVKIEAESESQLLVLSGEPIREPVASYGPFVMNTKAELLQAIDDFQSGRFGVLV